MSALSFILYCFMRIWWKNDNERGWMIISKLLLFRKLIPFSEALCQYVFVCSPDQTVDSCGRWSAFLSIPCGLIMESTERITHFESVQNQTPYFESNCPDSPIAHIAPAWKEMDLVVFETWLWYNPWDDTPLQRSALRPNMMVNWSSETWSTFDSIYLAFSLKLIHQWVRSVVSLADRWMRMVHHSFERAFRHSLQAWPFRGLFPPGENISLTDRVSSQSSIAWSSR
jgi:hypothetical protein